MRACLFFVLILIVGLANAGSITVSWTAPTQNEDGTPLVDLAAYKFYYGTSSGNYTDSVRVDNPGITTYLIENLPAGTYYIAATAINAGEEESAFSNEAVKTALGSPPQPPTNLVVEPTNLVAYALSQTRDTIVAYPIGTVPAGTACEATMRFNDKYVVPFNAVQWVGTARPEVVLAACGAG